MILINKKKSIISSKNNAGNSSLGSSSWVLVSGDMFSTELNSQVQGHLFVYRMKHTEKHASFFFSS